MNGDLRVAYRASREGPRDFVFVPNWFTNCEVVPELPSIQGWVEAMTSLGRLIFFDQPGTGASDPVTPGALPTLEQWADSITAVLDDLGSSEAVLIAVDGAFATAAIFAATHPSRTTALVALEAYADAGDRTEFVGEEALAAMLAMSGTGEFPHVLNPDMPWNEESRATWARMERLAASPRTVELDVSSCERSGRAGGSSDDPRPHPRRAARRRSVHDARDGQVHRRSLPGAKYVELPGRNAYHFVEPWRPSFEEIAEFLTGHRAEVADDRVLATVLFTDIVDSTRRAAETAAFDSAADQLRTADIHRLGAGVRK